MWRFSDIIVDVNAVRRMTIIFMNSQFVFVSVFKFGTALFIAAIRRQRVRFTFYVKFIHRQIRQDANFVKMIG